MCVAMAPMAMLGGVMQLGGSLMAASAEAAEGRRAREIADRNAQLTEEAGRYEAKQTRQRGRMVNSQARVQIASRGFAMSGSMLDVLADSSAQAEIDAANQVRTANDQADVQRMEGQAAEQRARNKGIATVIGGVTGFMRMAG